MKSKLYGPNAQVTHISGEAQCRRGWPSASTAIQSGCACADVVVGRVRVGPRDDDHAELPAARDQLAERIAVAQPPTAVMEGDLGGVVGDAAAGAQAGGVAMGAAEVVEPEREVERARVVLDQGQLGPAHGAVDPARGRADGRRGPDGGIAECDRGPRRSAGPQE